MHWIRGLPLHLKIEPARGDNGNGIFFSCRMDPRAGMVCGVWCVVRGVWWCLVCDMVWKVQIQTKGCAIEKHRGGQRTKGGSLRRTKRGHI